MVSTISDKAIPCNVPAHAAGSTTTININIFHDILGLTIMSLNSYLTKNNVHGGSKYCHSTINIFSFISGTIR